MPEEITDNEFYVVVWENKEYGVPNHTFVWLRNGETLFQYMLRVHQVDAEQISQVYKRIYVKQ